MPLTFQGDQIISVLYRLTKFVWDKIARNKKMAARIGHKEEVSALTMTRDESLNVFMLYGQSLHV